MSPGESQMLGFLKPEHKSPVMSVTNMSQSRHNQSQTLPIIQIITKATRTMTHYKLHGNALPFQLMRDIKRKYYSIGSEIATRGARAAENRTLCTPPTSNSMTLATWQQVRVAKKMHAQMPPKGQANHTLCDSSISNTCIK